jgi:hypothetical protein
MHSRSYNQRKTNNRLQSWIQTKAEIADSGDSLMNGLGVYVIAMGILVGIIKVVIPLIGFITNIFQNRD